MRGADEQPGSMFSYISPEQRVLIDHPLRDVRRITDRALERISPRFGTIYLQFGRPFVQPEKLLRALVLQALYSIRSERQLMEQLDYNILFPWFVGLGMDDAVGSPPRFTGPLVEGRHRPSLLRSGADSRRQRRLLSDEHFTVDGTLLEAWASHKSFHRKAGPTEPSDPPESGGSNPKTQFKGQRRSNATHQSTQGREALLGYLGHLVSGNRPA